MINRCMGCGVLVPDDEKLCFKCERGIYPPTMKRKILITNGSGGCGKDEFAKQLSKFISVYKYSSIDKVKEIASLAGWNEKKSEKDRRFLSDLKILTTEYNDMAFNDIKSIVKDFHKGLLDSMVLIIDIREPEEIERAKQEFDAITILIRNSNVKKINSNMADANVENYKYDCYIDNSGTIEELSKVVAAFYKTYILD